MFVNGRCSWRQVDVAFDGVGKGKGGSYVVVEVVVRDGHEVCCV